MKNDFIFVLISFFFGKAGFFIVSMLAANLLSVSDYAIYASIFTVINMISGTVGQAAFVTSNRYFSVSNFYWSLMLVCILISVVSAIIVYVYGIIKLSDFFTTFEISLISVTSFFCIIFNFNCGALYSLNENKKVAVINLIIFIVLVLSVYLSSAYGIRALIWGYFLFYFSGSVLSILQLNLRTMKFDNAFALNACRNVGGPQLMTSLAFLPMMAHFSISLMEVDTSGIEMAIYNIANQIRMLISFSPMIFSAFFVSKLVSGRVSAEVDWHVNTVFCTVLGLCLLSFLPIIVSLFGIEYNEYTTETIIMMICAGIVAALKSPISRQLIVKEKGFFSFLSNVVFGIIFTGYIMIHGVGNINAYLLSRAFFLSQLLHFFIFIKFFLKIDAVKLSYLISGNFLVSVSSLFICALSIYASFSVSVVNIILIVGYLIYTVKFTYNSGIIDAQV